MRHALLAALLIACACGLHAQELLVFKNSPTGTQITDDEAVGGARDFGAVAPSTVPTSLRVYFTNNRATPINFGAYYKTGANPYTFYVNTSSFVNPLPAGQSTFVDVTFYSTVTGTYSATLHVPHDALGAGTSPFDVNLTALCANQILKASLGSPAGPAISHDEPAPGTRRDFGSWPTIAGPTATITLWITNAGTGTLTMSTPDLGGLAWSEFVIDTSGFAPSLGAGQSTSVTVAFDPVSAGNKYAYVRIPHTDTTQPSPFSIPVTGIGLLVTAPVMGLSQGATVVADGGSRAVGSVPAGAATSLPFTISNTGNVSLNLTGSPVVQLTNTVNCTEVLAGGPATTVIPWGMSTGFTVGVTPAGHGAWSFDLSIANDDSARNPYDISVSGLGVVTPTELRVATLPANAAGLAYLTPAPMVAITDSAGLVRNDDNSTLVLVSITSGTGAPGAFVFGTLIVQASGGYVTYPDLRIDQPGTYRLTFTDITGPLGSVVSNSFSISGPPPGGSGSSSGSGGGCALSCPPTPQVLWLPGLLLGALALRRRRAGAL